MVGVAQDHERYGPHVSVCIEIHTEYSPQAPRAASTGSEPAVFIGVARDVKRRTSEMRTRLELSFSGRLNVLRQQLLPEPLGIERIRAIYLRVMNCDHCTGQDAPDSV